jgi:hypothetical protein
MVLVTESKLLKLINEAKSYIEVGWDHAGESVTLQDAIGDIEKELLQKNKVRERTP